MNPKVEYELKKFGYKEILYHILYRVLHSEKSYVKMLKIRDIYFSGLTEQKVKEEIVSMYKATTGDEDFDIDCPITFNQKIQWLKFYDNTSIKQLLADKYLCREWVMKQIGGDYLIPIIGVWDRFNDIEFDMLPNAFCLKMNNGCGMNYPVKCKTERVIDDAKRKFDLWEKTPYYAYNLELQYKNISPKIIAEEYIEETDGNLYDYKIHCFHGNPELIQVIGDRNLEYHKGKEAIFDLNWKRSELMYTTYERYDKDPEKPINLNEMVSIAKILSKDFIYARVDLYNIGGKIKFGELTFTPASGFGFWNDPISNQTVGKMINLPDKVGDLHKKSNDPYKKEN